MSTACLRGAARPTSSSDRPRHVRPPAVAYRRGSARQCPATRGSDMKVGFIGLGHAGGKLAGTLLRNGVELIGAGSRSSGCRAISGGRCAPSPKARGQMAENMRDRHHLPAVAGCIGCGHGRARTASSPASDQARSGWKCRPPTLAKSGGWRHSSRPPAPTPSIVRSPGGVHRAATGNISILAGCRREVFERVLPMLRILGRRILHTGEIGTRLDAQGDDQLSGDRQSADAVRGADDHEGGRHGSRHHL